MEGAMKRFAPLLLAVHLLQCRPIDLAEGWATSQDSNGGVVAKIVCQCDNQPDAIPASYVLQTQDIRQTCSEGDQLCVSPCRPTPKGS